MTIWNRAETMLVQAWQGIARSVRNILTWAAEERRKEADQVDLLRPRCCRTQHYR